VTIFLLQLIKCWTPRAAGKRSAAGRIFVAPPYYSQHAVFPSLWALFFIVILFLAQTATLSTMMLIGRNFCDPASYCHTVCLRWTPLLMWDPFVVANLRVEFHCHVQHPMFYLDICWGKCSWGWLLLLVKIKHSAHTWCLRHLSPVNLGLFILIDKLGILIGTKRL